MPKNYSQNDPSWSNQLLGHNTELPWTLGNYGCLITAFANACDRLGINEFDTKKHGIRELTPYWLDVCLTDLPNGYAPGGGDYVWGSLNQVVPNIIENDFLFKGSHSFNQFKDQIRNSNGICVIEIDSTPDTQNAEQHWVIIDSIDGDNVNILDSWDGVVKPFSDYFGTTVKSPQDSIFSAKIIEKRVIVTPDKDPTPLPPTEPISNQQKGLDVLNARTVFNQDDIKVLTGAINNQDYQYLIGDNAVIREDGQKLKEQNTGLAKSLSDSQHEYVFALDGKAKAEELTRQQNTILRDLQGQIKNLTERKEELLTTVDSHASKIETLNSVLDDKQKIVIKQGDLLNKNPTPWSWTEFVKGLIRRGILPSLAGLSVFLIAIISSPEFLSVVNQSKGLTLLIPMLPLIIEYLKTFNPKV